MAYIVYLDEAGDHSLELIDKGFPVFALAMFICDTTYYNHTILPAVAQLKTDYFGYEGVILHSRDIRKAQKYFGFLVNPQKRAEFIERINVMMRDFDYSLIVSAIKKQDHKEKYGMAANNPYDLAMKFCLERLLPFLEEARQKQVYLIAESRGKKEDNDLELSFLKIIPDFAIDFEENGLTSCQDKACEQKNRNRIRCNTVRTLLRAQRSNGKKLGHFTEIYCKFRDYQSGHGIQFGR